MINDHCNFLVEISKYSIVKMQANCPKAKAGVGLLGLIICLENCTSLYRFSE